MTPLHNAAFKGHIDTVKYLVEQGADIEARNDQNSTPLQHAACNDHIDVVKYLRLHRRTSKTKVCRPTSKTKVCIPTSKTKVWR